jgi:hypothetical protein
MATILEQARCASNRRLARSILKDVLPAGIHCLSEIRIGDRPVEHYIHRTIHQAFQRLHKVQVSIGNSWRPIRKVHYEIDVAGRFVELPVGSGTEYVKRTDAKLTTEIGDVGSLALDEFDQ